MSYFPTGRKKLDRKTISKMCDNELTITFENNQFLYKLLNDEYYWKRKFKEITPYIDMLVHEKDKKELTWGEYYIRVIYPLIKCKSIGKLNENLLAGCKNSNVGIVKICLKKGANPNYKNGLTLLNATKNGNIKIVKLLVKFGVDIGYKNYTNVKPGYWFKNIRKYILNIDSNAYNDMGFRTIFANPDGIGFEMNYDEMMIGVRSEGE